ncbi:glycerol-3-phosphate 1-O-acyltransferase PlsY [Wolbachia endosymbiont of Pentidionis agamae]|uniref:glycerol-3-phosphate 1-O-acyltransferase PlsY n=1 Tax=Wolbachia endosymbiont of Pentidionis agamae TaxID=3110435 RepID=UPI002FD622FF
MWVFEKFIVLVLSYILGSIPFSLIITKMKGIDLRLIGSGNIGATNVLRTGKKGLAALALLLDSLKGFFVVYLAQKIFSNNGLYVQLSAILAVLGHMFPVWLKFKGGKGVATALGILVSFNINIFLIFLLSWIIVFLIFRYSSLASLSATAIIAVASFFLEKDLFFMLLIIAILIFFKHRTNIINLLHGKESKFLY